jgi:hypothetical protein
MSNIQQKFELHKPFLIFIKNIFHYGTITKEEIGFSKAVKE